MKTKTPTSLRSIKQSLTSESDCRVVPPRNDVEEKYFDVAVIGAGPSGILAAIYAAREGAKVILLEKNEVIGRKILATGNGRCNISNTIITMDRYHGMDVSFAEPILAEFDAVDYFQSIGVLLKEEDRGRLFPRTDQASTVVDALKAELDRLNVKIFTNFTVKKVLSYSQEYESTLSWTISSEIGDTVTADKLILTTGGRAAHQLGSSGDGLFWAKNWGHSIVPIHAALVAMEAREAWVKDIMGIRLATTAKLLADGQEVESRGGDILFTHYGVSGPAAMGLAREVDPLLSTGKNVEISIDLAPDLSSEELNETISNLAAADGKKQINNILVGLVPKNLVPSILALSGIKLDTKAAELSKSARQAIICTIKDFRLTICKVRPLKEAQVTAGGIDTNEVTENLESKIIPSLYFAGEILDIDGDSGGFNLEWAWASGKVAGEAASRIRRK